MIVRNQSLDTTLGSSITMADTFGKRLRGLMFRKWLAPGEGLVIAPCNAIHTHFMRFPIDVLFLDEHWRVVQVIPAMRPWRQSPVVRGAKMVLELTSGGAGATVAGDQLQVEG